MGRIIGIDYGKKRIGLAISDAFNSFALPIGRLLQEKTPEKTIEALLKLAETKGSIDLFVIGLPLMMSGQESKMSIEVRQFASLLEKISGKEVAFIDERLTSKQADTLLRGGDLSRKKRDHVVDTVAATLILQTYLERTSI